VWLLRTSWSARLATKAARKSAKKSVVATANRADFRADRQPEGQIGRLSGVPSALASIRPVGGSEVVLLPGQADDVVPDLGELPGGRDWDRTSGLCCVRITK
jgi:hypothetical protein